MACRGGDRHAAGDGLADRGTAASMMSLHMGAAGSLTEGKAMAVYLLEQQIPREAMRAAAYYGQTPGVEDAIAAGYGPLRYCVTISILPWQPRLA